MTQRAVLSTVLSVLSMAVSIALPFWSMGYVYAVLRLSRKQPAPAGTLLEGFRRIWPVFRMLLLEGLLISGISMAVMYGSFILLSLTPLATPLVTLMEDMLASGSILEETVMDPAVIEAMTRALMPILLISAGVCVLVMIPVSYRLRLSTYRIMDDPTAGARAALSTSNRLMKGNCFALLRLDLSFWWYFLLEGAAVLLASGPELLLLLGIHLPASENAQYLLFGVLSICAQLLVYLRWRNYVEVTYANAYRAVAEEKTGEEPPCLPEQAL